MNANFCHSEVYTKKPTPWLEACCSVKATLQTYSNMVNHHCSKETFKLHMVAKTQNTSSKRTDGKRALCADAVPDGCPGLWEVQAGLSILCCLGQGFCQPGRHLWKWALGFPASPGHPCGCTCKWNLETGHCCYYRDFRGLHILFWPLHSFLFFSPLFLPFFPPSFNKILGTKTPRAGSDRAYNRQSSSQLNTPDVLPVPKGSHCLRGFLLNRTKQNSKALGLLGCWRETMGKQNSGQRDIYFSEGHGCPYTIPFKALWSFSNTIQSCSQAEIQRVQNPFIPSLM